MALLTIHGPHAIGKTTALLQLHEMLMRSDLPVTIVLADNNREMLWIGREHYELRHKGRAMWKGKAVEKARLVDECVADDTRIWIVETARMDTHRAVVEASQRYGGGAEAFLVVTTPTTFERLMRDRCKSNNKTFNVEYWTKVKLAYECRGATSTRQRRVSSPTTYPTTCIR